MNIQPKTVFLIGLLALPFSMAQASIINFDGALPFVNYDPVPAGFGSTPDVAVTYQTLDINGIQAYSDVLLWNAGYANLNTAAFAHTNGYLLSITLTAVNPQAAVTLNSFDVAAYPGPGNFTRNASYLRVVDGSNFNNVFVDYAPVNFFPVPGDVPHTFNPNVTAHTVSIILGTDWDNGVNNIIFNSSAVPLPASTWLLGSGLLGLIGVARRKAA